MDTDQQEQDQESRKNEMVMDRKAPSRGGFPRPVQWQGRILLFFSTLLLFAGTRCLFAFQEEKKDEMEKFKVKKEEIMKAFQETKKKYNFVSTSLEYREPPEKRKSDSIPTEVKRDILRIRQTVKKGMADKALEEAKVLLESNPFEARIHTLLGEVYLEQKKNEEAQEAFLMGVICDRGSAQAWEKLESLLQKKGKKAERFKVKRLAWMAEKDKAKKEEGPVIEGEEELWGELSGEEGPIPLFYNTGKLPQEVTVTWLLYLRNRALWREEGRFQKEFPGEKEYRPSFREEVDCFSVLADAWRLVRAERPEIQNPDLNALLEIQEKGLLKGYVLFEEFKGVLREGEGWSPEDLEIGKRYFYTFLAAR